MTEKRKASKELPGISPVVHLEADMFGKGLSLIISGVVGISEMSGNEIKLLLKFGSITITGNNIKIDVFESKTLHLSGIIDSIFFSKNKKEAKNRDKSG